MAMMKVIETKGDVVFFKINGIDKLYQKILNDPPIRVKDGKMAYKVIAYNLNGFRIKYNLNGVHGFAIFKGTTCLEDNIWVLEDAKRIAMELK